MHVVFSLALGGVTAVLAVVGLVFMALSWPLPLTHPEWGFPGFQALAALVFGVVAVLVSARRPSNPIGWLWHVAAILSTVQFLGHQYALYGLVKQPGAVPAPSVGTWIEEWIWLGILSAVGVFTFLLFPTGRLLTPRWRIVALAAGLSTAAGTAGFALMPTVRVPGAVNPIAPDGPPPVAEGVAYLGATVLALVLAAAAASLAIRFRRSVGVERQQLKWFALGAIVVCLALTVQTAEVVLGGSGFGGASVVTAFALLAIPLSLGLAMLRYGLYEVDRLINRTVVYAVVTALLGSLYVGTVLLFQPLLEGVTGGQTFLVAATTLLVASVFQPVRRRVQAEVDRRFFRGRYDAQLSAERLGALLRDEVDVDRMGRALLAEVSQTMRPSATSIWLRSR